MTSRTVAGTLAAVSLMMGILSVMLMYHYGLAMPTLITICVGYLCVFSSGLISGEKRKIATRNCGQSPGDES